MANNPPTVLFVEDCDSDFELACVGLQQMQLPVQPRRASCGREFKNMLSEQPVPVALFILDLSLPDTSGLVLARELRASQENAATPIVIFSSSTNPRDAEAARRCGADDYLVKPIAPDEFLKVVEQIVNRWLLNA